MSVKICVSGKIAAGKTTLAQALSHHFRIQVVSFGDVIRANLRKCGIESTREALHEKSKQIVASVGNYGAMDWFVAHSPQIDWGGDLIVEGCRHPETFKRMRELFAPCFLVHCSCTQAIQIQRMMKRDGLPINRVKEIISSPIEKDLDGEFSVMADLVHYQHTGETETIRALMSLLENRDKSST